MSGSDIKSWLSSAASYDDDDDDHDDNDSSGTWKKDKVLSEWPQAMEFAQNRLLVGRTSQRVEFLENELMVLVRTDELSLRQVLDIFKLLTLTYPRYTDVKSRDAVEALGMELVSKDEQKVEGRFGVAEQIIGWLKNESQQLSKRHASSIAPANLFVLLSWACGLYSTCLSANPSFLQNTIAWNGLLTSMALLLDMVLESDHAKPSIRKGALMRVRRALRDNSQHLPPVFTSLLAAAKSPAQSNPLKFIPLIGTAVSVTIRLKVGPPVAIEESIQKEILDIYSVSVIMAKTPVPNHILTSFSDVLSTFVTPQILTTTLLPATERAVLRTPEIALPIVTSFISAYTSGPNNTLSPDSFKRILAEAMGAAKSTNASVRALSIDLLQTLMKSTISMAPADYSPSQVAAVEILSLPKAGKTLGGDHRVVLYEMLGAIQASNEASPALVETAIPLLAKDTHEGATAKLAAALPNHLALVIGSEGKGLSKESTAIIVKELLSSKVPIRRAFVSVVGGAIYQSSTASTAPENFNVFAKAVLPGLETNLENVAGNPLGVSGGPLDGYVSAIVLLSLGQSSEFASKISANPALQNLLVMGIKPSFAIWDKVYQKLTAPEEEQWLLRLVSAILNSKTLGPKLKGDSADAKAARVNLGSILVHLTLNGSTPDVRRAVGVVVKDNVSKNPVITSHVIRDACCMSLGKAETDSPLKGPRLTGLLTAGLAFDEGVDEEAREQLLLSLVVDAHHPSICGKHQQTWIELCQKAGLDPYNIVNKHINHLFAAIIATTTSTDEQLVSASYRAISSLAFISPATVVPKIVEQVKTDLDRRDAESVGETEMAIWATPEGQTYVDVLSGSKQASNTHKGKNADIEKWEAELRSSIAAKKATGKAVTLTKPQQAAVQAQLIKEAAIRASVTALQGQLRRGFQLIQSLSTTGSLAEDEVKTHITVLLGLILDVSGARSCITLASNMAYNTYVGLSKSCSDRLDTFRPWIGIATLRGIRKEIVPEELQVEPLGSLILRVLHRLRYLSEQSPLDAASFSYANPLLRFVLLEGGVATEDPEESLEQVALSVDIIKFHVVEFANPLFPRSQTLDSLLHVTKHQPKLAKEASSTVINLGGAINENSTQEEKDVLLKGTLFQEVYVRNSSLQALQPFDLTELDWSPELLLACHDDDEQNARLARLLWEDNGLDIPSNFLLALQGFLGHDHGYVRTSVAAAIAESVRLLPDTLDQTVQALQQLYREKAKVLAPEYDQYGMVIAQSLDQSDPWQTRLAIARSFELLAPSLTADIMDPFFLFLISDEALGDRNSDVRRGMLAAANAAIDLHGKASLASLIQLFEGHLSSSSNGTEAGDYIHEAVVILFGRLARHLGSSDSRIPGIVDRLVESLKTPAEMVQIAVSDCLPPLVKMMRKTVGGLIDGLLSNLFNAEKYAVRRGSAYGLAGVVKGTGLQGFKEFGIINRLRAAAEDKTRYESRQGAMFAFETLSYTLGRMFEPYVTSLLPLLLACFGDATNDVREATQDAARVIMGNMSGYGVKLMLPSLLEGLDEKQWRTKKGSIELLGMMAYCSPRQLSISLPIVIPRLTGVLTDSHAQVRTTANKSLKQFGEVIANPEIQSIVPTLLKALVDPAKTPNALSALLKTSFMHYIDHSSLALVVPIIGRGLRERGAETKRKAAQIVGNLASLTDSKDFVPYLSELLPLVHVVLVDPVPEARATAAKSLGTLVERLGEIHFPDLVPSLLRTLKADTSGVDRQGAAQGLSEVLAGLGMDRMEGLLPDIIANAQSPRPTVREGFMSLLVYLPATFGTRFQPHLPKIIAPILGGLSDQEEYVREAAMRAGRMIITNYSSKAIDLLLPELENGMFDSGWRIRHASITLVGELLFKVSGISGKPTDLDEDEGVEAATGQSSNKALVEVLGVEKRDKLLASLYLVRQDGVAVVRQTSIQIWKAVVHNTPKTVREILNELMSLIVTLMAGDEFEQQETGGRTIGELCRKFGEKIVGDMMNNLRDKMMSPDTKTREGVCLVLCEVMENTTDAQREDHEDEIISMVRVSLVDDASNVRAAAAKAFDILQENIGAKAIDQTIPTLLEALRQPGKGSGTALQALREVMNVRANTVFPVLIPTLTALPMTVFNARALGSLVTVAGDALSRRLTTIMNTFVKVLEQDKDEELLEAVNEALKALLASIDDDDGLNTLMMLLLGWAKHDNPRRRVSALQFFSLFCEETELDTELYRVDWVRQLISSLDDQNKEVHTTALSTLSTFVKSIPKDELDALVVPLRRSIENTGAPGIDCPGFSLPSGVGSLVPIIIAGLTTGNNEQRENAAYAIGDLVERTSTDAIKPYVVPFTGPLIRVATQATSYPPAVKGAILSSLSSMLERIPIFVKPFFPQLQRTFVKSASDASSAVVRNKAAVALGVLMRHQPRVDPVVTELIAAANASVDDESVRASLVFALACVVKNGAKNIGEKVREACVEYGMEAFRDSYRDDNYVIAVARLIAALGLYGELVRPIVKSYLSAGTPPSSLCSHTIATILDPDEEWIADAPSENIFQQLGVLRTVAQKTLECAASERPDIGRPAREARDRLKVLDDDSLHGLF